MKSDCDTFNVIRVKEWRNNKTGMTTVRAYRNPTREELVAEARAAFSNHNTERLHGVLRTRDNITGSTMTITGMNPLYNPFHINKMPTKEPFIKGMNPLYNPFHINKPTKEPFIKTVQELFEMKPKKFMNEMLSPFRLAGECIFDMGETKWKEWTGELTKYSDSVGSIWVKNEVPKETTLRKVLNVLRRVK